MTRVENSDGIETDMMWPVLINAIRPTAVIGCGWRATCKQHTRRTGHAPERQILR